MDSILRSDAARNNIWLSLSGLIAIGLTILLTGRLSPIEGIYLIVTWAALWLFGIGLMSSAKFIRISWFLGLIRVIGLIVLMAIYILASIWLLHPNILPQRATYDFIENRHVTDRLVDPALIKVERWNILDKEENVLFVHPSSSGSTTLVYPLKIEPKTTFYSDLAMAPQAWSEEGDGVTFTIYVENDAGIHLLYSQYIDPKHQQQDRRWVPVEIGLDAFEGQLVRFIMVVSDGVAGDIRYDWAGWGEPRLVRPEWP